MAGDKTASYAVKIDANADEAKFAADALAKLKATIDSSQSSIKAMSAAMRNLRGASEDVKGAKAQLTARIEAEKGAISSATLQILKAGGSFEKLAKSEKHASTAMREGIGAAEGLAKGFERAGGPAGELVSKVKSIGEMFKGGAGGATLFAAAAGLVVAGVSAMVAGIADLAVKVGQFIFNAAAAAREARIFRFALTGSAEGAKRLGDWVDVLANKVPIAKDELARMSGEIFKSMRGTKVSGAGMIDTFNAVAQASAAMGDEAGRALQALVDKGKMTGRLQITPEDLIGTGLKVEDIAAPLAASMKLSIGQVKAMLASGRIDVNKGAAAIRAAAEKQFGALNKLKLLGPDEQLQTFRDHLKDLASGVNLEPFLEGLHEIVAMFDSSATTGSTFGKELKALVSTIGAELLPVARKLLPLLKGGLEGALSIARQTVSVFQEVKAKLEATFSGETGKNLDALKDRLAALLPSAQGIADTIIFTARVFGTAAEMAGNFASAIESILEVKDAVSAELRAVDWVDLGSSIIEGIKDGIVGAAGSLTDSVRSIAEGIKGTFTSALGISSPSKVFERYGEQTGEGYERGIESSSSGAQSAADGMAPTPAAIGRGVRGAGMSVEVHINVEAGAGANGQQLGQQLSQPEFLAMLTRAIREALVGAAVPTQAVPAP